jgi:hypothetical protein
VLATFSRLLGVLTAALIGIAAISPQTVSIRHASTCATAIFLGFLQRFFKPPPSSNSTEDRLNLPLQIDQLWNPRGHDRAISEWCREEQTWEAVFCREAF